MKPLIIVIALFLLFLATFFYGSWSFEKKILAARETVSMGIGTNIGQRLSETDLRPLPEPVRKWLHSSGAVGKQKIQLTKLKQSGLIRLNPEQKQWTTSNSEQIINLKDPAFAWNVKMSVNGLPVLGMDKFSQGEGSMFITLLGLIPIVNVGPQPKINQSALQRFLGEIIWSPTAAVSPWIQWTPIDKRAAKARMSIHGVSGEATFYFSESGDLEKFIALRFKEIADEKPLEWHADVKEAKVFHNLRIPSSIEATWMLPEGPFTWFKFEITEVEYK